jgi:PAS domain S-box-containing protein
MHSIVPEERAAVLAEWEACAREGREFSREFRLLRPDGSIRWVHSRTAPVYQEDGTLFGHVGTTEDITDRKRAAEAVRVSEERITLAVRGADEGIWDWDIVSN